MTEPKRCRQLGAHLWEEDPDGKIRCYRCRVELHPEGEAMSSSMIMYCPWCEEAIDPVMEGHDEFSTEWRCPKCGHRWEEW